MAYQFYSQAEADSVGYMKYPNPHTVFPEGVWFPHTAAEATEYADRIAAALRELLADARIQASDQVYHNAYRLTDLRDWIFNSPHGSIIYDTVVPVWHEINNFFTSAPARANSPHNPQRLGAVYEEGPPTNYISGKGGTPVYVPATQVINAADLPPDVDPYGYHGVIPYQGPRTATPPPATGVFTETGNYGGAPSPELISAYAAGNTTTPIATTNDDDSPFANIFEQTATDGLKIFGFPALHVAGAAAAVLIFMSMK